MEKQSKMTKKELFYIFLLTTWMMMCCYCDASRTINMDSDQKSIDIDEYLKRINKTPVNTIESPDGDIIDCIDIYKQPAFDNPLLKNHTLQMRPSHIPEGLFTNDIDSSDSDTTFHQEWQEYGSCPEGTIPIRRTTKEDLLRAESIERFGKKSPEERLRHPSNYSTLDTNKPNMIEDAMIIFIDRYYGAKSSMNIWLPNVQQSNEFSSASMILLGGPVDKDYNTVEVGWQVRPSYYGDFKLRFYVHWTNDGEVNTGCFDLKCGGFVQTNKNIVLGSFFKYLSEYDGNQFYLDLTVFKSPGDGNWWLAIKQSEIVGYWPASLFTHLNDGASDIRVGGQILNRKTDGKHTTTQMGSGHFSVEGYGKASYFRNIKVVNAIGEIAKNPSLEDYVNDVSNFNCYDVKVEQYDDGKIGMYHGGPGRNERCP